MLLSTKLFKPALRPELIPRPYLVEKLETGQRRKLILVSAPAGYGKTTLLGQWIDQQATRFGWVSLDANDNDLGSFFSYIIASLQSLGIAVNEDILSTLQNQQEDSVSTFLFQLINQLSASSGQFSLVLDDYHSIHNQEIHKALTYILNNLPPNMHLIIATRSDPPLRLAKLRAQGELCEVRVDDLRFTVQEAVQYFNQSMGLVLSPDDIATLTRKTEGWIVGLQLAGISLQTHPDKHNFVITFAGHDRYIADYLLDEALNRQPAHIQTFLLQTSILDRLSAALCNAVTGRNDSQTILEEMDRANLFLVPLDSQRSWYRYHHLFGELLNNRLQHAIPGKTQELHSRASHWYTDAGLLNQAATHAIKANDILQLERLIQENMLALLETGESILLENYLSAFQASFEESNMWVCIARAWSSVFSGQIPSTENALQEAEALLSTLEDEDDLIQMNKALGHISTIRGYIASLKGETSEEKNLAQKALKLLPEDDHATIAYASMILASAFLRSGEIEQAENACLDAIQACEAIPDSYIKIDALCMLSQLQQIQGELQKTYDTIEQALQITPKIQIPEFRHLPIIGFAKIRKSSILYEWNELDRAEDNLNQGIAMIEKWGEKDSYLAGIVQSILFFKSKRNIDQALEAAKQGKIESKGLAYWYNVLDVIETWLYAKIGNSTHVDRWLKKHDYLLNQQPTFEQEFIYRLLIEILILRGDFTRAKNILKSFLPVMERSDSIDRLIRISIIQCKVLCGLGEDVKAMTMLSDALELAQPRGYFRVFIDGGEKIAQLLYQCVQQGIHKQYCSKLLEAFQTDTKAIYTRESDSDTDLFIEPLSQREVEVLQLVAEGCTNKEIAKELIVSLSTVKSHARNIFGKLGVKNRTEAVAKARLFGLLPQDQVSK